MYFAENKINNTKTIIKKTVIHTQIGIENLKVCGSNGGTTSLHGTTVDLFVKGSISIHTAFSPQYCVN